MITYGDLRIAVEGWTTIFDSHGLPENAAILLDVTDPTEFATIFLGVLAAGRCAVPVDPNAPVADLLRNIEATGAVLAITDRPDRLDALPLLGLLSSAVEGVAGSPAAGAGSMRLSTSGSTGAPKVVELHEQQLLHVARAIAAHNELTEADRGYCSLPLFHINAEVVGLLSTLVAGATLVLDRRLNRHGFWAMLAGHKITWLNAVPAIYAILAREAIPVAHAELRFVRSASAPLPAQLRAMIESDLGVPVVESYGMTEAASQITAGPIDGSAPVGSVGRPVAVELDIRSTQGDSMPVDEIGRVWLRGDGVVTAYLDGRSADRFDADRWLDSGDLGYLDADGFLFLAGRADDVINRGGELVYPQEVQEVLLGDPRVLEAVVVGRPDPILGEIPVALVIAAEQDSRFIDELMTRCEVQLSRFKRPASIEVVADLPRTATGKIRTQLVRTELMQDCRP